MNKIIPVILFCFLLCFCAVIWLEDSRENSDFVIVTQPPVLSAETTSSADDFSPPVHTDENSNRLPLDPFPMDASTALINTDSLHPVDFIKNNTLKTVVVPVTDTMPPNEELQNYVESAASVDGTQIRITAENVNGQYLSGKLESVVAFTYFDFTFRVNTVRGEGLFPAIWMLPASGSNLPELDLYESLGNDPEKFYGVLHYPGDNARERQFFTYDFPGDALPESYTVRFVWNADEISWYLEGEKLYSITDNIPTEPMYLIFNLAVGGDWPGAPTDLTAFPATFEVTVEKFLPQNVYIR